MAQSSLSAKTLGFCMANLELGSNQYTNIHLSILPGLYAYLHLGLDFQKQHLSVLKVEPTDLFAKLVSNCHPIATK